MAKPVVDQGLCVGCRLCATACPQVFEINEDEKAVVVGPDACTMCDCQQAIDTCPAQAISWSE